MNKNPLVDQYLQDKDHPLDTEIKAVRDIILSIHPEITEAIKWSSPTFIYKGNMASYFMNAKKHVSLMFHKGALIDDKTGLLEGDGKEARTAKFHGLDDIEKRKADLESVVQTWINLRDNM